MYSFVVGTATWLYNIYERTVKKKTETADKAIQVTLDQEPVANKAKANVKRDISDYWIEEGDELIRECIEEFGKCR